MKRTTKSSKRLISQLKKRLINTLKPVAFITYKSLLIVQMNGATSGNTFYAKFKTTWLHDYRPRIGTHFSRLQ